MNKIIVHISDLHITDHLGIFNKVNDNTFLNTDENNSANFSFIDKLSAKINSRFPTNEKILIVTGDITNVAEVKEFEFAHSYLTKLATNLSIDKKNVVLIPGDHDIHRDSVRNGLRESINAGKEGYQLLKEKYQNFSAFYKKFKSNDFDYTKIIFETIEIDSNILLLAVNSNYKVGHNPAPGFIHIEQFDSELENIAIKHKGKQLLISFHHNISGVYENKITGQWEVENRKDLIHLLEKHKVKCIFYGNEHTPRSTKLDSTEIYISESGAVSGIKPLGTFKCYEIFNSVDFIKIENHPFTLVKSDTQNETNAGDWIDIIPANQRRDEINEFIILDNVKVLSENLSIVTLPSSTNDQAVIPDETILESSANSIGTTILYNNQYFSKGLYEIVRKKKLFQSGHFHWSETSRAHNWIDISKLLESKEDLHFVKDSIIDVIETFDLAKDCDLIIGLGYEGNIISTKASIKYNKPYTSLPYSYRYNDHNEFEKNLNYENSGGEFKTVIIITDVVNDGRTIRKLIGKRCADFFEKVDRIIVISLFYTGDVEKVNTDILNYNKRLPNTAYDFENDHEVNNIEFYTVRKLKVDKCPYGKDYKDECLIYKDELSCVHLFYDVKE